MIGLLGAIQFLTRIPVRLEAAVDHHRVVPWFPVVGALIGAAVGGVAAGVTELATPAVGAAVAVAVGLLITGAFHEDGLADTADAFGGGWTIERRLEILKDSRHGTYGVAALVASIAIRITAIASLSDWATMLAAVVAAHALGRGAAVATMTIAPPARESGLGVEAARSLRWLPTASGLAVGLAIVAALTGWWVLPLLVVAGAGVAAVTVLAIRKIGGLAGDVLGAVEQVVECLVLVAAVALAQRHQLWWR